MNRFFLKIVLPSILSILLFILTIFQIIIPQFQHNIMNGKREMIKELTNSALSILSKYEIDEKNGLLTSEEAQDIAVSRIQYLRYGEENKDYFWITDLYPNMIMHPYRPDLNGKDLSNFIDPHGKKLFVEFVKTVKKSDNGYVDYMWQWKDDSLHIVPKLSYVSVFKPWGWVIGTGVYIEDVKAEINALTKKLIWISIGISILIAFLLVFISQQSFKIERKRIEAENKLHHSKEKYKTLVEAATEGLIMLIDGKISLSNSIISRMTGYETSELINHSLKELLSENNNVDVIDIFSKTSIREGQFELNLKKKNGGFLQVLLTASNAQLNNNLVNIITIKDITIAGNSNLTDIDYQKLINTINIGVFRIRIDSKSKLLYANETAIKILGSDNFHDLSDTNILEMLENSEDRKNLRSILLKDNFIKNRVLKIRRKNGELATVTLTLIVFNSGQSEKLICDGIIEDITLSEQAEEEANELITSLKSSDFLMEETINEFIAPINKLDSSSTLKQVIHLTTNRKTDCLLLTKNQNEILGIITNSDIQNRILRLNLQLDNPAYLIMSSPVAYIRENTSIADFITVCEEKNVHHLVVKNDVGEISGVVCLNDIYKAIKDSLGFFTSSIRKSESNEELKQLYKKLQQFVKPLIKSELSVQYITNLTTTFSDAITKRIIELAINDLGEPPVRFSFICMGSEGRKEETLFTDQDNAIIYEDVSREKATSASDYFNKLGEQVCNSLNTVGYKFCKGNIMAKNRQWCQPVSVWSNYFSSWITTPEPQNLLDATIFFDFRNVYGETEFTDYLRISIRNKIKENPLFLYHLAHNTSHIKLQQLSSGTIISDKGSDIIDLKEAVAPIVMLIRTYSLQKDLVETNTIMRLNSLKAINCIQAATADEILFAYNFLMKLRFKNQMELMNNDLPLSNSLNTKKLIEIELSILKKVLAMVPVYQTKISTDFRITT